MAAGDGAAFGVLAERLSPMLKRVLFRLGLEAAEVEDAGQETLVRIWRGSPQYRGAASVSTWACQIAINQGISLLRGRRRPPLEIEADHVVGDPEGEGERRQQAAEVRRAVLDLPLPLRSVVVLREFEDLPYREIAAVLAIPIGTVMSRLHEGRARLRRRLSALASAS
ncbi:MAG: hypothetical protein NVS9B1_22550 [Candidatus Dormibacteraceae bacterium]